MKKKDTLFEEVQYLRDFRIILYLKLLILCIVIGSFIHSIYEIAFTPDQVNMNEFIMLNIVHAFTFSFLCTLIFICRLVTQVNPKGLSVRFIPFHFRMKEIDLKNIKHIEAKQYRPIMEYGGWGIRMGWKKKAYNVHGNKGVEILYKDDRKLLIGSQRADELTEAIKSILK